LAGIGMFRVSWNSLTGIESATRRLILLCVTPHCQQKKGRETIPAVGKTADRWERVRYVVA